LVKHTSSKVLTLLTTNNLSLHTGAAVCSFLTCWDWN